MTALSLPDLMLAISAELSQLASATETLHDLVGSDSPPGRPLDPHFLRRAQGIDHATQLLGELAGFCSNLAADMPADCRVDAGQALSLLRLSDLHDRLASGGQAARSRAPSDGACELF